MKTTKVWEFSDLQVKRSEHAAFIQLKLNFDTIGVQFLDRCGGPQGYANLTNKEAKTIAEKLLELANELETDQPSK